MLSNQIDHQKSTPLDRLVPYPELVTVLGLTYSRVHLGRLVKAGAFPRPVQVSPGRVAWRMSDLRAWLASRQ
jgi:prophage regulatory protein